MTQTTKQIILNMVVGLMLIPALALVGAVVFLPAIFGDAYGQDPRWLALYILYFGIGFAIWRPFR